MFKKIDMFVFWAGISFNIIVLVLSVLLLVSYGEVDLDKIKVYGNIIFYAILFFHKLKDKSFRIKYFLGYVIVSFITGKAIVFMVNSISEQGSEGRVVEVLSFALVATFLACYLEGFLYQTFKKISHEKSNK
ncbi:hypothetical protein [Fusobacterium varium]|uniref:hypothetical protein n=1 Tax=Fusobacterium varium TaxID=856 RepID=UPI00242CD1FD|nr:hypothetical protein [Fusobacterium varium]